MYNKNVVKTPVKQLTPSNWTEVCSLIFKKIVYVKAQIELSLQKEKKI
jgi:hypothetical protein